MTDFINYYYLLLIVTGSYYLDILPIVIMSDYRSYTNEQQRKINACTLNSSATTTAI